MDDKELTEALEKDPCNNKLTYADKWDTPENRESYKKVTKFYKLGYCCSDCPVSWAKEVLELLTEIKDTYGFARRTEFYYYPLFPKNAHKYSMKFYNAFKGTNPF